jgi:hypothetical protein
MGIFEDLASGKYNLILICVLFIFMFHQYWCASSVDKSIRRNQDKKTESMSNISNDIKEAVRQQYVADVEAIRNLSEIATKLQKEGLTIPGNLIVTGTITSNGQIKSNGEISNNNYSLSSLNGKIDNINSSLSTNINNQANSIKSTLSTNYSDLERKINEYNNDYLWGVNRGGGIYRCKKPCDSGNWQQIPGGLITISQGKKYIWGSNGNQVYRCLKPCDSGNWQPIPGGLNVIDVSGND